MSGAEGPTCSCINTKKIIDPDSNACICDAAQMFIEDASDSNDVKACICNSARNVLTDIGDSSCYCDAVAHWTWDITAEACLCNSAVNRVTDGLDTETCICDAAGYYVEKISGGVSACICDISKGFEA